MDPDENLREQLEIIEWLGGGWADAGPPDGDFFVYEREQKLERLCELVVALDSWLRGGGFLPKAWKR